MSHEPEPVRRVSRRIAEGVGLTELEALEGPLRRVEEAVAENARLSAPLEQHLTRLEALLVQVLETPSREDAADDT